MPLPLTPRQKNFYKHLLDVYREDTSSEDEHGNPLPGSVSAVAGLQGIECKYHSTYQADTKRAPGVKVNQDNLETLDEVRFVFGHDIRERDYLRITSKASGTEEWFRVAGAPRTNEGRANSAHVLLNKTPPPAGV